MDTIILLLKCGAGICLGLAFLFFLNWLGYVVSERDK